MIRYLRAALLACPNLPVFGKVPVNLVACVAVAIAGFWFPAAWYVGGGALALLIGTLAFNSRFRNLVDASARLTAGQPREEKKSALVRQLAPKALNRLRVLEDRSIRVLENYRQSQADDFTVTATRQALDSLQESYLRLLVLQQNLEQAAGQVSGSRIRREITALERELASPGLPESLRRTHTATLHILQQRLRNFQNRNQKMEEIESSLKQIEAQVELAREKASMLDQPEALIPDIRMASDLLATGGYADLATAFGPETEPLSPETSGGPQPEKEGASG